MRIDPELSLRRILPATRPWPLHDVAASRLVEARAQALLPPGTLMRRAGLAVARLAMALRPHGRDAWIAAGPGGNGGDGLHAAAELATRGWRVRLSLLANAASLGPDAAQGLARAQAAGVSILPSLPEPGPLDVQIDALLGIGARQGPQGAMGEAVRRMNGAAALRLAVDLPSGLAADHGVDLAGDGVQADATLSLLTLKPGLFTASGRARCGDIWFDDLGAPALLGEAFTAPALARLSFAGDAQAVAPVRDPASHKGTHGDVYVIGGAPGMVGAARLAAHAAGAGGAGRTLVALLDPDAARQDPIRPEWLWPSAPWLGEPSALAGHTVVCGCGGGSAVAAVLPAIFRDAGRLVLDADALNAVAAEPGLAAALRGRSAQQRPTILTPHPLEVARLLATSSAAVQGDRLGAARELARRYEAIVVLKGSGTVVAGSGLQTVINSSGHAALASGGTGDVLAGWLGGSWAACGSGRAGSLAPDAELQRAYRVAIAAVWLHGAAAPPSARLAVRALDLVDAMRLQVESWR
jgi:ADP-dependent NAD(P)H-hydrate dehydratase / NAD(P)H-hydrate epimerase